ncbi:MAG: response regulator [Crocinitomicaceae bacterium]|nr:response regulator [Crocinitomicaceae bacterium]
MDKIKTIIVDDEQSARNILKNLLNRFCSDIELMAICTNIPEAVEEIKKHKPLLVFLDIEMPKYAGYEIVNFFDEVNFEIIFVTAYDKYAIKAFEVSAMDYLLKPIEIDRLKNSVERIKNRVSSAKQDVSINHLKNTIETKEISSIVTTMNGYKYVINLEDLIAIEAQESYSYIYTKKKKYTASKNLKHFERLFEENHKLIRVHKSWIINLDRMINYSKTDLEINLEHNLVAKLSKYKKAEFEQSIQMK